MQRGPTGLSAAVVIRNYDEWKCDGRRSAGRGRGSDDHTKARAYCQSIATHRRSRFTVARPRFRFPIMPIRQMKSLRDKRQEILFALPSQLIRIGQLNL